MAHKSSPENEAKLFDVCVIGLGYVGLTLATAFSLKGLKVAGVEKNLDVVSILKGGRPQFHELGLDEAFHSVVKTEKLSIFDSNFLPNALAYAITVGTPVRNSVVHLQDIEEVLTQVADAMPDGSLIVLRSTVKVGTTRKIAKEILDSSGKNYRLAMAPERTLEGRALAELTSLPQIIGGIDDESSVLSAKLFSNLGVETIILDNPEEAELAKLFSNTYRDVQFAFANEVAYMADFVGVNAENIINACNYNYPRMNLARPGPVAGPCLEKDAYILQASAVDFGTSAGLSMFARSTNEQIVRHVCNLIKKALSTSGNLTFGILGLAFKGRPETSDTRGSIAGPLASELLNQYASAKVIGWDSLVSVEDSEALGVVFEPLNEVIKSSDILIIQTNHSFFNSKEFHDKLLAVENNKLIVIDLWNQIDKEIVNSFKCTYLALGNSTQIH